MRSVFQMAVRLRKYKGWIVIHCQQMTVNHPVRSRQPIGLVNSYGKSVHQNHLSVLPHWYHLTRLKIWKYAQYNRNKRASIRFITDFFQIASEKTNPNPLMKSNSMSYCQGKKPVVHNTLTTASSGMLIDDAFYFWKIIAVYKLIFLPTTNFLKCFHKCSNFSDGEQMCWIRSTFEALHIWKQKSSLS